MPRTRYARHGDAEYSSKTALGCEKDGEPVFLLRAQDEFAADLVRAWADQVEPHSQELANDARAIATAMEAWPRHKTPD